MRHLPDSATTNTDAQTPENIRGHQGTLIITSGEHEMLHIGGFSLISSLVV